MSNQHSLMKFDPATGEEKPYPSHAKQWRVYHGESTAWLFNPWNGQRRGAGDVGTDICGFLILPPGEYASVDRDVLGGQKSIGPPCSQCQYFALQRSTQRVLCTANHMFGDFSCFVQKRYGVSDFVRVV